MAIVVETLDQAALGKQVRLPRKMWLVEDKSHVVEDGDPEAAFLYGCEGTLVPESEAIKLGAIPSPKARKRKEVTEESTEEKS